MPETGWGTISEIKNCFYVKLIMFAVSTGSVSNGNVRMMMRVCWTLLLSGAVCVSPTGNVCYWCVKWSTFYCTFFSCLYTLVGDRSGCDRCEVKVTATHENHSCGLYVISNRRGSKMFVTHSGVNSGLVRAWRFHLCCHLSVKTCNLLLFLECVHLLKMLTCNFLN